MKRKLLLIGLIGAAIYVVTRLLQTPEGADESGASKAAAAIRERAPVVAEYVGRATKKGAQTLREMTNADDVSDGHFDSESPAKDAATSEAAG